MNLPTAIRLENVEVVRTRTGAEARDYIFGLEKRFQESCGVVQGLAPFIEYSCGDMPHVKHVGPDIEPHFDTGCACAGSEPCGVVQQNLSRSYLYQQRG